MSRIEDELAAKIAKRFHDQFVARRRDTDDSISRELRQLLEDTNQEALMAAGIYDCKGRKINVGDKVRTEFGDVIEVCGALVNEHRMFNAEECEVVSQDTELTNTGITETTRKREPHHKAATEAGVQALATAAVKGGTAGHLDCVVWGN